MDEYGHYVTYRNATDQTRERTQRVERSGIPHARHTGRKALARRLHSIADRLDG